MMSVISSSEHLSSHKGLTNMNNSSKYHQNLPHQQLPTNLQEPRSEALVDGVCEPYQICLIPTILNGQIMYDSKGEIISSAYHENLIYTALRESSVKVQQEYLVCEE
jgi:hypothetical protein